MNQGADRISLWQRAMEDYRADLAKNGIARVKKAKAARRRSTRAAQRQRKKERSVFDKMARVPRMHFGWTEEWQRDTMGWERVYYDCLRFRAITQAA